MFHANKFTTRQKLPWELLIIVALIYLPLSGFADAGPGTDGDATPEAGGPSQQERQKELLYTELENLLRTKEGTLAIQLVKVRRQQDQLISTLSQCIAMRPANLQDERIANEAALLLARYRGPDVLFALSRNIDLRTDRYTTMRSSSAEGMIGFTEMRYPCVRSLVIQGEPAVKAILRCSLPPDHKRSDLQLELAAYALLEICCPVERREGVLVPQVVRDELEMLADERFDDIGPRGTSLETSLFTFKRFLQKVEPYYYRYPMRGQKYDLGPAKGSSIFASQSQEGSRIE